LKHLLPALLAALLGCSSALPQPRPTAGPPVSAEAPVVIYGATWCAYTQAAHTYFQQHHVPVVFRNVEQDNDAWEEMHQRVQSAGVTATGIPILDVRGHILVGFQVEDVERVLAE
jgi:glutaredoxin